MKTLLTPVLSAVIGISASSCREDGGGAGSALPEGFDPLTEIRCEFVGFDQAEGNGRCADFRLINPTEAVIVGVRGEILGYDSAGAEIYDFPWGSSALPMLVGARSETMIEDAGFQIPPEVERVEYRLEAVDFK